MKNLSKIIFGTCAMFWLFLSSVNAQPPITGRLASALEKTKADTTIVVLVFFYDKGFPPRTN